MFGPDGLVLLADGTRKRVDEIVKGDEFPSGARVIAAVVFNTTTGYSLVNVKGAMFSPHHPVSTGAATSEPWVEAIDAACEYDVHVEDIVYNFVLDKDNVIDINGVHAVTLAHDFNDATLDHPYFGRTKLVLVDLMKKGGWFDGLVVFNDPLIFRDADGLVCKIA